MEDTFGIQRVVGSGPGARRQNIQLWEVGVSRRMRIPSLGLYLGGEGESKVKPEQVAGIVVPTGPRSVEGSRIGQEGGQRWCLAEGR